MGGHGFPLCRRLLRAWRALIGREKAIRQRDAALLRELRDLLPPAPGNAVLLPRVNGISAAILLAAARPEEGLGNDSAPTEIVDEFGVSRVIVVHDVGSVRNFFGYVKGLPSEISSDDVPKGLRHDSEMARKQADETPADHKVEAGQRLRAARVAVGYSELRRFAENTGVTEDNLSNWERGVALVPTWYVQRIKELFAINHDWIYGGDPARLPHDLAQKLLTEDKRL